MRIPQGLKAQVWVGGWVYGLKARTLSFYISGNLAAESFSRVRFYQNDKMVRGKRGKHGKSYRRSIFLCPWAAGEALGKVALPVK